MGCPWRRRTRVKQSLRNSKTSGTSGTPPSRGLSNQPKKGDEGLERSPQGCNRQFTLLSCRIHGRDLSCRFLNFSDTSRRCTRVPQPSVSTHPKNAPKGPAPSPQDAGSSPLRLAPRRFWFCATFRNARDPSLRVFDIPGEHQIPCFLVRWHGFPVIYQTSRRNECAYL
jgi:hypothetical protein